MSDGSRVGVTQRGNRAIGLLLHRGYARDHGLGASDSTHQQRRIESENVAAEKNASYQGNEGHHHPAQEQNVSRLLYSAHEDWSRFEPNHCHECCEAERSHKEDGRIGHPPEPRAH